MAKITKEMIARILAHVGGAANVAQAGNCMTRLRLTLRDESLADSAAIRQIDGVMGVIVSDEQFQVVLGPGKAQTAAEMMNGLLEAAPAPPPPGGGGGRPRPRAGPGGTASPHKTPRLGLPEVQLGLLPGSGGT
ncbi:PTS transporter subunit EIIB, partial [Klebsiella pneumoniae]|uniref:PTS transporter subunit EIIB n=1 Tax=Klebsiella pneumoniae TaxID=573 RepID=UPI0030F1F2B8